MTSHFYFHIPTSSNMVWTWAQRAFAVETFLKNGESVIATQRTFQTHYKLGRNAGSG